MDLGANEKIGFPSQRKAHRLKPEICGELPLLRVESGRQLIGARLDRLQTEGPAQEISEGAGDAKDAIKKSVNKVTGTVNRKPLISLLLNQTGRLLRGGLRGARRTKVAHRALTVGAVGHGANNLARRCTSPERKGGPPVY